MAKKKGGKKKKKSKAQEEAERLQREEEERLEREAREERERQEKIERERQLELERLERARLRKEELERLSEEAADAAALVQRLDRNRKELLATVQEKKQWRTYVESTCRPNPTVQSEIASMIEEWQHEPHDNLEIVLADCNDVELCVQDISDLIGDLVTQSPLDLDASSSRIPQLRAVVRQLRKEEQKKLDRASAHILIHRHKFVTSKAEVLVSASSEFHRLGIWMNAGAKAARVKAIEYPATGIRVEVQKAIATQPIAIRACFSKYDNWSVPAQQGDIDAQPYAGVLCIELLRLPEESKQVKHWTITPYDEEMHEGVRRIRYPPDGEAPDSVAPITIKYAVPDEAVVREPIRVAWWDDSDESWNEEDIYDIRFDSEQRTVQFQTTHLTALAIVQPVDLEIPYRSWHIRPAAQGNILYALKTARFDIRFLVDTDGKCALIGPHLPEFQSFIETPMEVLQLLEKLKLAGINIQPGSLPATSGESELKDPEMEERVYTELSAISAAFGIYSDTRNASLGKRKCAVHVREAISADIDQISLSDNDDEEGQTKEEAVAEDAAEQPPNSQDPGTEGVESKQGDPDPSTGNISEEKANSGGEASSMEETSAEGQVQAPADDSGGKSKPSDAPGEVPDLHNTEGENEEKNTDTEESAEAKLNSEGEAEGSKNSEPAIVFEVDEEVQDKVKCCLYREATIEESPTIDTHVYLLSLIKTEGFADEAIYRVNETPLHITETLRTLLRLTRPLSFSG